MAELGGAHVVSEKGEIRGKEQEEEAGSPDSL